VQLWRDLAGDGVADPDRVGARFDLREGECDARLGGDVHQLGCIVGVVHQVIEEIDRSAKVGGFGGGAFYPTKDRVFTLEPIPVGFNCSDPVHHAFTRIRIRPLEPGKVPVFFQRTLAPGYAVGPILDDTAETLRFTIGVGYAAQLVDPKLQGAGFVGLDEHFIIGGEGPVVRSDELGGELHQDGHTGNEVRV